MKKIPLQNTEHPTDTDAIAPRFLREALDVLLLGTLWLFVLVWMPFYQSEFEAGVPDAVFKMQWMAGLGLSLGTVLLRWGRRYEQRFFRWELLSLMLIAILSIVALFLRNAAWFTGYVDAVCIAQALSGLLYFVMSRVQIK